MRRSAIARENQELVWLAFPPLRRRARPRPSTLPEYLLSRFDNAIHLASNEQEIEKLIHQLGSRSLEVRRRAHSLVRPRLISRQGLFRCPMPKCPEVIEFWRREVPSILTIDMELGLIVTCPAH